MSADKIRELKDLSMVNLESKLWSTFGNDMDPKDRRMVYAIFLIMCYFFYFNYYNLQKVKTLKTVLFFELWARKMSCLIC